MNMITEHSWNDTVREISKLWAKNLSKRHFFQHKTQIWELKSLWSRSQVNTCYLVPVQPFENIKCILQIISFNRFHSIQLFFFIKILSQERSKQ